MEDTVIVEGYMINASVNAIMNTKACIGHDCLLSDFVSVAQAVALGRGVNLKL